MQKLNYHNNLPQNIALSIQGLQASGELFGGAAKSSKRESWAPIIPIDQPAGDLLVSFCHPCKTRPIKPIAALSGMWVIEDDQSLKSQLPHKYGVDDIPLIWYKTWNLTVTVTII